MAFSLSSAPSTIDSSFGRESVVPSSNQQSDPALAPPRTMPSTERNTSFQSLSWRVLAMKLGWSDGSTSSLLGPEVARGGRYLQAEI